MDFSSFQASFFTGPLVLTGGLPLAIFSQHGGTYEEHDEEWHVQRRILKLFHRKGRDTAVVRKMARPSSLPAPNRESQSLKGPISLGECEVVPTAG